MKIVVNLCSFGGEFIEFYFTIPFTNMANMIMMILNAPFREPQTHLSDPRKSDMRT